MEEGSCEVSKGVTKGGRGEKKRGCRDKDWAEKGSRSSLKERLTSPISEGLYEKCVQMFVAFELQTSVSDNKTHFST